MKYYLEVIGDGTYILDKVYSGGPHEVDKATYLTAKADSDIGVPVKAYLSDESLEPVTAEEPSNPGPLTKDDVLLGTDAARNQPADDPEETPEPQPPADPVKFTCEVEGCGKQYASEARLAKHVEEVHASED